MSLKSKVVSAAKWSALAEIASKGITPIVFIILAWLLKPKEFGLVAIATMFISFSQIFWDAGLSKALIQRQGEVEKTANIVFWTNMVLGVVIYGLLFLSAGFIAHLFKEPLAETVIKVQGLQIILASLFSVQTALLQKELNFKKLFYVRLLTSVLPGFASIPFALWGFGYWALVVGSLVGAFGQLVILWSISLWRPQLEYDTQIAKQLFKFGFWVTGEGLLMWLIVWLDAMIVGTYMGSENLGLYRTGNTFVVLIFGLLLSPLLPVLFSSFSQMQHDKNRLTAAILKSTKAVTLVAFPIGVGLFIVSDLLETFIFGDKWLGIGTVIGWMGLMHGISWIVGVNSDAYRAIGRADLSTKIMLLCLLYYIPTYLIAVQYNLEVFLIVRFLVACAAIPIHFFIADKYLGLKWHVVLKELSWIIAAVILMGLLGYTFSANLIGMDEWQRLLFVVPLAVVLYLIFLFKEWGFLHELINTTLNKK
jgi:PST family polysaccharide transporter